MISITILFAILIIHWVADFVLQTDEEAKGKSKNWLDLINHTLTYSVIWLIFLLPYSTLLWFDGKIYFSGVFLIPFSFFVITFLCHTITDYYTSRVNSGLWAEGKTHDFFVAIGFDQLLHYFQLVLTYYYLMNFYGR